MLTYQTSDKLETAAEPADEKRDALTAEENQVVQEKLRKIGTCSTGKSKRWI